MAEKELKWYGIFVVLFGTILSIADPITDFLMMVEFYVADHKTWFGLGLTFVVLPSFFFAFLNVFTFGATGSDDGDCLSAACTFPHVLIAGYNPLPLAWLKMRTLYCYLKKLLKLRQSNNTYQTDEDLGELLSLSKFAFLLVAALESAPQFIIQLYAMAVQEESVSIVQMVSLPVSFLSLAWASTVGDEFIHDYEEDFSVKERVLHFVTHLFILSSRLFAVALFTVSYKWWVTSVLIFHCTVMVITIHGVRRKRKRFDYDSAFITAFLSCSHWLRDDLLAFLEDDKGKYFRMQLVSNVLFVIENITMILLFYFSHFRHTWYSLPVTICVCLFAVLGAVMRLTRFYFFYKDPDGQSNNTDRQELLELDFNALEAEAENEGR